HGSFVTNISQSFKRQSPTAVAACVIARISACAVGSFSISTWLYPRPMMRPFFAITAPIGTSSLAAALVARRKASRISAWSSRESRSISGKIRPHAQKSANQVTKRCAQILREFRPMPERQVPRAVLRHARGLAVMRVVKVGFVFSGKGGEGVVIARTGNGWSGPSFIGTGGAGWGLQMGAEVTDFVF